jgi:hypothetical protein
MTESASRRMRLRALGSLQFGNWGAGDERPRRQGGKEARRQDKANWRSRTRRPSAVEKPLSAHWFLEARRLAHDEVQSKPAGAFQDSERISVSYATALAIFSSNVSAFL